MPTNRPLPSPLPADLPEDWQDGQIVAPQGPDVGLTEQHGYNYLMQQVNDAQRAVNQQGENKQDKLTGTQGQVVGFDEDGSAVPQPGVGRSMAGQSVEPTQGTTVTAGDGAEVFNDYRARAYDDQGVPIAGNVVSGEYSHAEGVSNTVTGAHAHAEGELNVASGEDSHVEGEQCVASGTQSHAEGYLCQATDFHAHAEGRGCVASGQNAHAEGRGCVASGQNSHAEGSSVIIDNITHATTASGSASHAEGLGTTASSTYGSSHAEGYLTIASGQYGSHAEGSYTKATSNSAHAEGSDTTANGSASHAEGSHTTAKGYYSHAEGSYTTANENDSHAEGSYTTANGYNSHAEGNYTTANGYNSHAGGQGTIANSYQTVVGTYNVEKPGDVDKDRFIVGGGWSTPKNAFRVEASGACYGAGAWNTSGADYAELFEWQDRNLDNEDRAGLFVTLDGEYIRIATPEDDYILGIVSATPSVVGDVYDDQWAGMYLRDVFGRTVMELQDFPAETMEVPGENGEMETIEIRPPFRASAPVVNPDYDHTEPYQPRTKRPEWDAVGLLGKLVAVDDGTCQVNGWATVGPGGVATASPQRTKYRVMARLDDSHVRMMIL